MDDETFDQQRETVSRSRRYRYVRNTSWASLVVAVALSVGAGLGIFTEDLTMLEISVKGLLSLTMALSLGYVGGSVIDYNGGIKNTLIGGTPSKDKESKG